MDDAVGSLLGVIDELGQASSTLTLFTSDNGPSLRWKGGAGTVGPFVGAAAAFANGTSYRNTAKGSTWEGGIRMPAFVHWPGTVTPGGAADTVISTLDVLPSLLRVLQRPMPTGRTLDGTLSLADVILSSSSGGGRRVRHGADPPTRHAFLPFYNEPSYGNASHRIFAARYGRYKAHWITSPGLGGGLLPYTSPTLEATHSPPLVFDVEADPEEAFPLPPASLPPVLLAELAKPRRRTSRSSPRRRSRASGVRVRALLWRRLHAAMRVPVQGRPTAAVSCGSSGLSLCATYVSYTAPGVLVLRPTRYGVGSE